MRSLFGSPLKLVQERTRGGAGAREAGKTHGFIKVIVDADSERFLGAAILGLSGDEAMHCNTDVMYADASQTPIQRAMHIHKTLAELLPTMLGELEPLNR